MDTLLKDLRYGLRVLTRNAGFSAAAVLSLALGIGASAAIFTVVHAVLLKPLPYPEADRIAQAWQIGPTGRPMQTSDANYEDLRDANRTLAAVAQYSVSTESVTGGTEAARVRVAYVSRGFFRVMGLNPSIGRTFVAEEQRNGGRRAMVVSRALWRKLLAGEPDLQRRSLTVDGFPHAVVGVLPESFAFPAEVDVWVPRELWPRLPSRTAHNWLMVARLKDGVSLEQARADVSAIGKGLKARYGSDIWLTDFGLVPLHEQMVSNVRPALLVLLGAVGFLLLVACANVANLMLAQLTARGRELAVRSALGASTWRLNRQLLTEATMLAAAGGLLGFILAPWAVRMLLLLDPGRLPRAADVQVDLQVALFTLAIAGGVALVLALAAGTRRGRTDANEALKGSGRSQVAGRGEERLRGTLVAAQVALSLMLLIGAGLLGRTLLRILDRDPGFRSDRVVALDLSVPGADEMTARTQRAQFYERLMTQLRALPGVTAVGGINGLPLTGNYSDGTFIIQQPGEAFTTPDGKPDFQRFAGLMKDPSRSGQAQYRLASEGYFTTMGIPLRQGRLFEERDGPDAPHVALISESLAKRTWPDGDAIGKIIQYGNMDGDMRPFTIVGIVGDVSDATLDTAPRPTFYASYRQRTRTISNFSVVIATSGDPRAIGSAAEQMVRRMRPDVPPRVRLLDDVVAASLADRRFNMWLLIAFGACAVVLAGVGIYGVTAFWVSRRIQEFGIRLTLGATPAEVVRMVVARTGVVVGLGLAAGIAGALALTRLLSALLFDVRPTDPVTFGGAIVVLAAVALLAGIVPARRASRVDPAIAMREDR
jgi:predicted permease